MKLRSTSFLGLSVGEKAIACAEVMLAGERREVRHAATFPVSAEDLSPGKVGATGQALAGFLRQHGFSSSRAVVGVPAKWLIALEREVPPAGQEQARSILRLQAERLSVSESGEMVFDYVGSSDSSAAKKVLLVGMPRQRMEQVENLLDSAGLTALAISSSALTLACGEGAGEATRPMVLLGQQGAELVLCHMGSPRLLRHVSTPSTNGEGTITLGPLGSELSRALAMSGGGTTGGAKDVILWDGIGLSKDQLGELQGRLGVKVTSGEAATMLRVTSTNGLAGNGKAGGEGAGREFAPAISLALAGADRRRLPLDFRNSRLTPPRKRRVNNLSLWGIIGGTLAVAGLIYLYATVTLLQSEFTQKSGDLKKMEPALKSARAQVDKVNYGEGFFETRAPTLECLREITLLVKPEDPIWVTAFSLRENRKGQFSGKSSDQRVPNDLAQRMQSDKKFADVKVQDLRGDAAGRSKDWTFTISFTYTAPE